MSLSSRSTRRVALGSLFALTVAVTSPTVFAGDKADEAKRKQEVKLGLDGYCPVCIVDARKWIRGKPEFETTYDGVTYRFPGDGPKQKFRADPARYVPALGGDCVVCYANAGKRVPGSIHHAAFHRGRLYLFPSEREQQAFLDKPADFENVDLALKGECAVCLAMKKHVPGKPEFTAIHHGLRYQFPSDRQRQMFLKEPARFAVQEPVTLKGRTGCAGCDYGVTPIGAPDELGLAVTTPDGQVIVVEDAHEKWPAIYEARFEGGQVEVTGRIIRESGRIKWLQPTALRVVEAG
jgi:YHS domain-containing protein